MTGEHLIDADYVIVGAGAVAMAFADTLLSETAADMIIGWVGSTGSVTLLDT